MSNTYVTIFFFCSDSEEELWKKGIQTIKSRPTKNFLQFENKPIWRRDGIIYYNPVILLFMPRNLAEFIGWLPFIPPNFLASVFLCVPTSIVSDEELVATGHNEIKRLSLDEVNKLQIYFL